MVISSQAESAVCTKCLTEKPLSEFWYDTKKQKYLQRCNLCRLTVNKQYRAANREQERERQRRWKEENPERFLEYHKHWRESHRELVNSYTAKWRENHRDIARAATAAWRQENLEHIKQADKKRNIAYKDIVYAAYGGYVCACCGVTIKEFLTLDHINNDGAQHRREIYKAPQLKDRRGANRSMYKWIVDNNFPAMFQILCINCNVGKYKNHGICPHKDPEGSTTIPNGSRSEADADRSAMRRFREIVQDKLAEDIV